jgi:hypothetical protein
MSGSMIASLRSLVVQVKTMEAVQNQERASRIQLEDAAQQAQRFEQDMTQRMVKLEQSTEQDADEWRNTLATTATELTDAHRGLLQTVEAYNDEVESRVNVLTKRFLETTEDTKNQFEAVDNDFHQVISRVEENIFDQASRFEERFNTDRRATQEKWDTVERNVTLRVGEVDQRIQDHKASLTHMLEESNLRHDTTRERDAKKVTELFKDAREHMDATEDKFAAVVSDLRLETQHSFAEDDERVAGVLTKFRDSLQKDLLDVKRECESVTFEHTKGMGHLQTRLGDDINLVNKEIQQVAAQLRTELLNADARSAQELRDELTRANEGWSYDLDTLSKTVEARNDELETKLILEEQSRTQAVAATEQKLIQKMDESVRALGKVIDSEENKIHDLTVVIGKMGSEITDKISTVDKEMTMRIKSLEGQVKEQVQKSIIDMTRKMDELSVRIKSDIGPKLVRDLSASTGHH